MAGHDERKAHYSYSRFVAETFEVWGRWLPELHPRDREHVEELASLLARRTGVPFPLPGMAGGSGERDGSDNGGRGPRNEKRPEA